MNSSAFERAVAALSVGKRLPGGVYAHVEALPLLPDALREAVEAAQRIAALAAGAFQVVKLSTRGQRVSLLAYPGFFEEAFPMLAGSWAVDLEAGTVV